MKYSFFCLTLLLCAAFFLSSFPASAVTTNTVQTQASVGSTLTITIIGIPGSTPVNTQNPGCVNTETTSPNAATTATGVNLGQLTNNITIAAQRIVVTTNSTSGYSLLAQTNGYFVNSVANFRLGSSVVPSSFPLTGHFFGIHACGHDLSVSTWGSGKTMRGSNALYVWPSAETQLLITSDTTGPIDATVEPGNGVTTIQYAATIDATVPGGTYAGVITFTVSPTF